MQVGFRDYEVLSVDNRVTNSGWGVLRKNIGGKEQMWGPHLHEGSIWKRMKYGWEIETTPRSCY